MFTKVSVEGFKSLQHLDGLELGTVNVFIGANGSGKSNLLEAVGILATAASGRVADQELLHHGVRAGEPALYKTSLKNQNFPRLITLQASGKWDEVTVDYKISLSNPIERPKATWEYETEILTKDSQKILGRSRHGQRFVASVEGLNQDALDLDASAGLAAFLRGHKELSGAPAQLLNGLRDYCIYAPSTPILRGIQPDPEQQDPVGLYGGRLPEAIEEILDPEKGLFGTADIDDILSLLDWVDSFDIASPSRQLISSSVPAMRKVIRFTDRWMRDQRNQLSGYDASEGALYVLFMLTLALHPRIPTLFAVDNFDLSMHPRLARSLTRLFCQSMLQSNLPKQALITTHNPLVLDGLNLRDDQIRLFAVERNTQGATVVARVKVSEKILRANQDEGLSLSNLWVMGRLGGVPDLF